MRNVGLVTRTHVNKSQTRPHTGPTRSWAFVSMQCPPFSFKSQFFDTGTQRKSDVKKETSHQAMLKAMVA